MFRYLVCCFAATMTQTAMTFGLFNAKANGGGVAFFTHVGGFIFGLLITRLLVRAGQVTPRRDTPTVGCKPKEADARWGMPRISARPWKRSGASPGDQCAQPPGGGAAAGRLP
jgi:hypothetical protein